MIVWEVVGLSPRINPSSVRWRRSIRPWIKSFFICENCLLFYVSLFWERKKVCAATNVLLYVLFFLSDLSIVNRSFSSQSFHKEICSPWAKYGFGAPPPLKKTIFFLKALNLLTKKIHVNMENIEMHIVVGLIFQSTLGRRKNWKLGSMIRHCLLNWVLFDQFLSYIQ